MGILSIVNNIPPVFPNVQLEGAKVNGESLIMITSTKQIFVFEDLAYVEPKLFSNQYEGNEGFFNSFLRE